jgi:hypothetical protein
MATPPSIIEPAAPALDVERTMTVNKPTDHFNEVLYVSCILALLGFVIFMGHVHNDSLASKGMDFILIFIGALTNASTGKKL